MQQDRPHWIEAVDPLGRFWVENLAGPTALTFFDGTREIILDGFGYVPNKSQPNPWDPNLIFLPSGEGLLFPGCVPDNPPCQLFLAEINDSTLSLPEPLTSVEGFRSFWASPDSRWVSLVGSDRFVLIDLETKEIVRQLPWVETRSAPSSMAWSPDSRLIATDIDRLEKRGNVTFDVMTGEVEELLVGEGIYEVVDWRILPIGNQIERTDP